MTGPILDLAGALGETVETLTARLGATTFDRHVGDQRWIAFEGPGWSLRVRATADDDRPPLIRSWTARFDPGFDSLTDACRALGLPMPDAADVGSPGGQGEAMLRLALRDDDAGRVDTLTAERHDGKIRAVTAFDEAPDWESQDTE